MVNTRKQPEYQDRMFVTTIVGHINDRGIVIGFGFRSDGLEMWMVERPDKTVFSVPAIQMARLWKADCFDGYKETSFKNVHAEGSHMILRLTKPG